MTPGRGRGPDSGRHYVFRHRWLVPAPAVEVYAVLAAAEDYPRWWPQVRGTERIDETRGYAVVRAALPYSLRLLLEQEVVDASAGLLRARVSGDLVGWCSWSVRPDGARGARADFEQEVVLGAGRLRTWEPVLRPLLLANHAAMMRGGRRGLTAYLSGRGRGS